MSSVPAPRRMQTLSGTPLASIQQALRGAGLRLDFGAVLLRLRSDSQALASQLQAVYGNFQFDATTAWADLHVDVMRQRGLRRWLAPQVV